MADIRKKPEAHMLSGSQFQLVRQAVLAGWLAAGGTPAQDQRIFTCIKGENAQNDRTSTD